MRRPEAFAPLCVIVDKLSKIGPDAVIAQLVDPAGPVGLDAAAARVYASLGYRVVPIDVSTIYRLNGSLGCLVNVMARD